jgi:hypothetical protein
MTPLRAAKAQCDNYQPDGSCLGIASRGDLSMYRFRKEGLPCHLCSGERGSYFEEIIMPMRLERPVEAKSLASAVAPISVSTGCKPFCGFVLSAEKRRFKPGKGYVLTVVQNTGVKRTKNTIPIGSAKIGLLTTTVNGFFA